MKFADPTLYNSVVVVAALIALTLVIYVLSTIIGRLIRANTQLASEILVFKAYEKGGPPMAAGVLSAQKLAGIAAMQPKQEKAPQEKQKESLPTGLHIDQTFH